ncbi:MAG: exodeoxyribonuclease VII small subunit [Anaerolineales bacterium]|nr:exodeoxyribonuclease VII small subunit [Anaerolineales bacterium]
MLYQNDISSMKYEEAVKELEEIIQKLESQELPLEESISLFERGQAISAHCSQLLENAELKVQQVTPTGTIQDL